MWFYIKISLILTLCYSPRWYWMQWLTVCQRFYYQNKVTEHRLLLGFCSYCFWFQYKYEQEGERKNTLIKCSPHARAISPVLYSWECLYTSISPCFFWLCPRFCTASHTLVLPAHQQPSGGGGKRQFLEYGIYFKIFSFKNWMRHLLEP